VARKVRASVSAWGRSFREFCRRLVDAALVGRVFWLFRRLERQYRFSAILGGPKLLLLPDGSGAVVLVGEEGGTVLLPLLRWETPREGVLKLWGEVETGTPESREERGWPLALRDPEDVDRPLNKFREPGMKAVSVIRPEAPYPHGDLTVTVYKSERLSGEASDGR
jgi:hypothetical protein